MQHTIKKYNLPLFGVVLFLLSFTLSITVGILNTRGNVSGIPDDISGTKLVKGAIYYQSVQFGDTASVDAFGRARVSNPETIFDSKNTHDDADIANTAEQQPLFYDNQETSGGGTFTTYATSSQVVGVASSTAGTRVRQTRMRFNYQPGKSQLVDMTFNMNGTQTGITKREGIFDESNGLFLQFIGSDISFVRRTNTTGTVADFGVSQSNWNIDPMDGSGPSSITLDWEKTQIMVIDYEWLGVGRVRMGFNVDGRTYYAHQFLNANNLTEVYMLTPNLPLRSEISNDGSGAESTISQICSTVISEGGRQNTGIIHASSTAGTSVSFPTENVIYGVMGMRLKAAYLDTTIDLISASVDMFSTTDEIEWFVLLNPTKTDTGTWRNQENSAIQVSTSTPSMVLTGGTIIGHGYLSTGSNAGGARSSAGELQNAIRLGSLIDGTPDQIWLGIRQIGGTTGAEIEGGLIWLEQL